MYSEKAKKHADACRFCWMCRHVCPIENSTGMETGTPRAKGLLVSLFERGYNMDKDCAQTMYECMLCGSCTNDCVTGFEPPIYIREARTQAVLNDLVPNAVQKVIDRLDETGNIYGAKESAVDFTGVPENGELMVWLGATARYAVPQVADALFSLLKKANVDFGVLKDEPPSGCARGDLMGFVEDVRSDAMVASQAVLAAGAKMLVVLDSYDAVLMLHEYKAWGIEMPKIITATTFVDGLVKDGKLKPRKEELVVSYHDGSRLARDLDEHQPARDLLESMGMRISEMFLNRRLAHCCGTSVAAQYMPKIRTDAAKNRWSDVMRTEARTLIAACPQSTEAFISTVPEGYTYKDLFVLLDEHT